MTLFASLKTNTLGLGAQSQKMASISDNIANVSTVGYKKFQVQFASLVTEELKSTKFTPGGVIAKPRQLVDEQGIIQGSNSDTDFAITGRGFFMVHEQPTSSVAQEDLYYTRAGSFQEDADGFLFNTAGYYLMGVPTDRNGTPARDGVELSTQSLSSYEAVDVNRIASVAEATENLQIRANIPAEATAGLTVYDLETAADAAGEDSTMSTDEVLAGIINGSADFEQVVNIYDAHGTPRDLTLNWYRVPGSVTSPTATAQNASTSSVISFGTNIFTDSGSTPSVTADASNILVDLSSLSVTLDDGLTLNVGTAAGLTSGQTLRAALTAMNGTSITSGNRTFAINASLTGGAAANTGSLIFRVDETIQVDDTPTQPNTTTSVFASPQAVTAAISSIGSFNYSTNVYDSTGNQISLNTTNSTTTDASSTPNEWVLYMDPRTGMEGLKNSTSTVVGDEIGMVSFFGNFDSRSAADAGNDVTTAVGQESNSTEVGQAIFVKFNGDGSLRNVWFDLESMRSDNTSRALLNRETDAGETPRQIGIGAYTSVLVNDGEGNGTLPYSEGETFTTTGDVSPVRVKNPSGTSNQTVPVNIDYSQTFLNSTYVSTYTTANGISLSNTNADFKVADNISVSGTTLDLVANTVRSPFSEDGAKPLFFEYFIGRPTTLGDNVTSSTTSTNTQEYDGTGLEGITNFDSGETVPTLETIFISQDGIRAGIVIGSRLDSDGKLYAQYDNGLERPIYQLALADFTAPNQLTNVSGNVYQENEDSGDLVIKLPDSSGAGSTLGSTLEQSNVDLAEEFTDMIVTQQSFTANTRAITTTDEMLTDINNLIR